MNNAKRMVTISILCVFLCLCGFGCAAQSTEPVSAETKALLKEEKKAKAAEKARIKQEEKVRKAQARKAKRQAAEEAKRLAKAEAKSKAAEKAEAKRLAKAEAKRKAAEKDEAKRLAKAEAKLKAAEKTSTKREEKARKAELLKDQREAGEKAKREEKARKAEIRRAKHEADKKAKREAAAKAKVDKEEKARLAKLDAEIKKQTKAEIALAKSNKEKKLAELDAKAKKQAKEQAKHIKAEKANLKRQFEKDKSRLAAEYKQAKTDFAKKEKAALDAEHKKTVSRLDAEYKNALAETKDKASIQSAQITQAKRENKTALTVLNNKAKKQAQEIKTEKASLKRKLAKDKARIEAEYKQSKKIKMTKQERARLDANHKNALSQLGAEYKDALVEVKDRADAQASQIAQEKSANKAELAALNAKAKEQAKEIEVEKANLKRKLAQDKADIPPYGVANLDAEYKDKLGQLGAEYKKSVAKLDEETLQIAQQKKRIEADYQETVAKIKIKQRHRKEIEQVARINLPEDPSLRLDVSEIVISGNDLVSTAELLEGMPVIYNASDKPLDEADSSDLYDLSTVIEVMLEPGQVRQITARTVQGLTQYILSVYQSRNYAGIYVYVPAGALKDNKLMADLLPVKVLEAPVTDVTVKSYDPDQNEKEKGFLQSSFVEEWSPVQAGQVANQKELDDFVNLLNLNPDRYVSAVVTKGAEPGSLAVGYDIYEADPWHWFVQADNSGTSPRQWDPRIGVINTNLLGFDDTFTAVYQVPWDSTITDNYSLYGSYDFPIAGPKLRLNAYGGHSEFDISEESGVFDFLGRGTFYGGVLRYNALQKDGWFVDLKGMLEHTRSKVSSFLFAVTPITASDVKFWLWGYGVDLHRSDDMSDTSLTFDRFESWGGESDATEFNLARTGSKSDFSIYQAMAAHSQFIDPNKVQRVSTSLRWIGSNERLVPAKMTSFGGMYSVRGYDEYEVVADGGVLASVQYEFDLVKYDESKRTGEVEQEQKQPKKYELKKFAPVVFADYGRTAIRHPNANLGEKKHVTMFSVGVGAIVEIGEHFNGVIYYGHPLRKSETTKRGKGRLNAGVMLRW